MGIKLNPVSLAGARGSYMKRYCPTTQVRTRMLALVAADSVLCWAAERGSRWALPPSSPQRLHPSQAKAAAQRKDKKTL
jgi:hypothetical protein